MLRNKTYNIERKSNNKITILLAMTLILGFSTQEIFSITTPKALGAEVAAVQKGMVLSLEDCIEIALKNSPTVKKSRYNWQLSKTNVTLAKSRPFATI